MKEIHHPEYKWGLTQWYYQWCFLLTHWHQERRWNGSKTTNEQQNLTTSSATQALKSVYKHSINNLYNKQDKKNIFLDIFIHFLTDVHSDYNLAMPNCNIISYFEIFCIQVHIVIHIYMDLLITLLCRNMLLADKLLPISNVVEEPIRLVGRKLAQHTVLKTFRFIAFNI